MQTWKARLRHFVTHAVLTTLLTLSGMVSVAIGQPSLAGPAHPRVTNVRLLPTTRGINHEFVDPVQHPDFVSATQLTLSFDVILGDAPTPVRLTSDLISARAGSQCVGPCNLRVIERVAEGVERPVHEFINCSFHANREAVCDIDILRFAQFGSLAGPMPVTWLVTMPDGEQNLRGKMHTRLTDEGALRYPAAIELAGHMIVTVQIGLEDPVRLLSRKMPVFRGETPGWPPYGATGRLVNGPIEYFLDRDIDNPEAKPVMTVTNNEVRLGTARSDFFANPPRITSARRLREGGVKVEWEAAAPQEQMEITQFNIYRNLQPGNLETWQKIAVAPPSERSFLDTAVDGTTAAEYAVSHSVKYPFGYHYEGTVSPPQRP